MSQEEVKENISTPIEEETPVVDNTSPTEITEENKKEVAEEEADGMDDLFGDEEEEDENKSVDEQSEDDDIGSRPRRTDIDEEEAMYTRKFYGDDDYNRYSSDQDNALHHFKEENVELIRHMVPYKTSSEKTDETTVYYAKVPPFLTINPVPFDPIAFESDVRDRLSNYSSKEDQLGDRLIDENTVRWRYSRDANQRVFKESNAQIVQWSDGSFSLKLGDEYTDILVNETNNTFLAVSHDQQELMQCYNGGEITKTLMFIPTSTNSKIHQQLSKAVTRRNQREHLGPGTMIINRDPEVEKRELEKKQGQIIRDRRRRQLKEKELLESPDTTMDVSGGYETRKRNTPNPSLGSRRQDEYEEDDFLVDDEDEEDFIEDDEEEEEEEEEEDNDEEKAERLRNAKRSGYDEDNQESGTENESSSSKKRRVAVINDDEDDE
ncbi:hypothetical protein NCAS_0H02080 [Naumovozyma castellii]|uniref:Leo1-like protein n=1 Tax=Naumovozyma castellii TaxID=27288 RepID=G0VJ39_NAUCA|nr:hypothetical protein NCAS_0H02080 [Naumovozyma castellii CBS 4309]CCC71518.1 hypothetical protein NCAS_0H02080 [Naumovozyma castellii CBS 4309]